MALEPEVVADLDSRLTSLDIVTTNANGIEIGRMFNREQFEAACGVSIPCDDVDSYLESKFLDGTLWCAGWRDGMKVYGFTCEL